MQDNMSTQDRVIWQNPQNNTPQYFRRVIAELLQKTKETRMLGAILVLVYLAEFAKFVNLHWAN